MQNKEPFQKGERVKHRIKGIEGTVEGIHPQARRRIVWDDDRTTLTHVGDLMEMVD